MADRLAEILAHKHVEVAGARARVPRAELDAQIRDLPPCRGFVRALQAGPEPLSLIAEVKKASPSQGLIRADFDPVAIATAYDRAGASCLSVLTDVRFFQGSPENLRRVRGALSLPILRKDFTIDSYQIAEARTWGADAVLLIMAALSDAQISDFQSEAHTLGLDVLIEVHDDDETERALRLLSQSDPAKTIIGVNNRNLATFETDLSTSERLIPLIAPYCLAVSESALATSDDLLRVAQAGARAVLIGTTFCGARDVEAKVREVMGW
jgi:indole-3-glycerol phosphate synthase